MCRPTKTVFLLFFSHRCPLYCCWLPIWLNRGKEKKKNEFRNDCYTRLTDGTPPHNKSILKHLTIWFKVIASMYVCVQINLIFGWKSIYTYALKKRFQHESNHHFLSFINLNNVSMLQSSAHSNPNPFKTSNLLSTIAFIVFLSLFVQFGVWLKLRWLSHIENWDFHSVQRITDKLMNLIGV